MKKGFACPSCGSLDTATMIVGRPNGSDATILLLSQKQLADDEQEVSCRLCRFSGTVGEFRIRRDSMASLLRKVRI